MRGLARCSTRETDASRSSAKEETHEAFTFHPPPTKSPARLFSLREKRKRVSVDSKQVRQGGMRVRVKRSHSMPELQGQVGTIDQHYGVVDYPAFKVWFEDGRSELFWSHELEEA